LIFFRLIGASMQENGIYPRIYRIIRRIPPGRVATYGQIARLVGIAGHARQVGYALHSMPEGSHLPWHRVVNRNGQIRIPSNPLARSMQRTFLEAEGVAFGADECIDLVKYQWKA